MLCLSVEHSWHTYFLRITPSTCYGTLEQPNIPLDHCHPKVLKTPSLHTWQRLPRTKMHATKQHIQFLVICMYLCCVGIRYQTREHAELQNYRTSLWRTVKHKKTSSQPQHRTTNTNTTPKLPSPTQIHYATRFVSLPHFTNTHTIVQRA